VAVVVESGGPLVGSSGSSLLPPWIQLPAPIRDI
jgi:hypothetical protein